MLYNKVMKKLIPYLFIALYATLMLKPVMPYIADGVAHILNYKDHIATVHAHNGNYHVHREVSDNVKNENSEKNTNSLKKEVSENDHIVNYKADVPNLQYTSLKYFALLYISVASIILNNDFPPPKYIAVT